MGNFYVSLDTQIKMRDFVKEYEFKTHSEAIEALLKCYIPKRKKEIKDK